MKKLLTTILAGSFTILTATAQDQIKSYTVEKYDGTQYVKQDSVSYLWSTNQDDERLLNIFTSQWYRAPILYDGSYFNSYDNQTTYSWDAANSRYFTSVVYTQELNVLGQIKKRARQLLDSGNIENESMWEYSYDLNGNVVEDIYYTWGDTSWVALNKLNRKFFGNQVDTALILMRGNSSWDQNSIITYKYENSRLMEKFSKLLIGSNPQGMNYQKFIYTYDTVNNSKSELVQRWSVSMWEDLERLTTYYNSANQVDSTIFESPAGIISKRKVFKYNSNGLSEVVSSNYNVSQQKYYPQVRFSFNYNPNGTLQSVIEESIDASGWLIKSDDLRYNYNYQTRVGLAEHSSFANFKIYPNPTSDQITISTKGNRINQIRIVDLSGKVVFENQSTLNANEIKVPIHQLENGTYILTVTSNGQQKSEKVVVNH
ncbi:T9SS type A sorting domain-containing protein [Acidiluteibacter ferrifornacis]|uniref:T9SS type A sorting domain-containing protein n=1 Tax=Acidiluteibacter ferrifornacis TaxID=2692424 RepID=A0A6N9NJM7_9FLAO|nr:T9SS type A sorting domain-containing protein [Acidiluteibacter ferrifornacis]NBG66059.1 T9SS type A sorting domain-containing protein [Acidiluteibacter ferrifornacis]